MSAQIPKFKQHLIVCGCGTTASHIIAELDSYKKAKSDNHNLGTDIYARDYIAIDKNPEQEKNCRRRYNHCNFLPGDATDDEVLEKANISEAYGLFTALPEDKDNLFITVTARQKNPYIKIIARTADVFNTGKMLIKAGANAIVSPNFIGGLRLVSEVSRPDVTEFLDEMLRNKDSDLHIKEIIIHSDSEICGKSLAELRLAEELELLVVATIKSNQNGQYLYNPPAHTRINANDTIVIFGKGAKITLLEAMNK